MGYYGYYGLGLSKDWGKRHGISPVLYCYPESITARELKEVIDWASNVGGGAVPDGWDYVFRLKQFTKPYVGSLIRGGRRYDNVRFYDEREWRYVPTPDECAPHYYGMSEREFMDLDLRSHANGCVQEVCCLSFDPDDIKYIIVAREDEILPMIEMINVVKSPKYDEDTRRVLSSRVISAEQIESDF